MCFTNHVPILTNEKNINTHCLVIKINGLVIKIVSKERFGFHLIIYIQNFSRSYVYNDPKRT